MIRRCALRSRAASGVGTRLVGAVLLVGLVACAPAAAPAPAATSAAVTGAAPSGPPAGPSDWDQTVAAAKQEGTVSISGPPGDIWRAFVLKFQDAYPGIQVDYTPADSRDYWPKLAQERQASQYLWDLRVGGPDPQVFAARDSGTLDPVRPLLVLPEVLDDSKWSGGLDAIWADDQKQYMPDFIGQGDYTAYVNRDVVTTDQLSSDTQLLDPQWKGKMSIQDPRGGAGLGTLTTMLVLYGEDYVRQLLTQQDLVVTGDNRQMTEWAVRDQYPIAIGMSDQDLTQFLSQGIGQDVQGLGNLEKLSAGFGGIQLINQRPHPNASKVFVNWLLSQQGQTDMATITQSNSRRLDVPQGQPTKAIDPVLAPHLVEHQKETLLPQRQEAQQMAQELLQ